MAHARATVIIVRLLLQLPMASWHHKIVHPQRRRSLIVRAPVMQYIRQTDGAGGRDGRTDGERQVLHSIIIGGCKAEQGRYRSNSGRTRYRPPRVLSIDRRERYIRARHKLDVSSLPWRTDGRTDARFPPADKKKGQEKTEEHDTIHGLHKIQITASPSTVQCTPPSCWWLNSRTSLFLTLFAPYSSSSSSSKEQFKYNNDGTMGWDPRKKEFQ